MQKTLPLYLGPSVIGSVIIEGDGHRLTVFAKTYIALTGICRAYIKSATGKLLVGVLSPDGNAYSAKHTFTREVLNAAGVVPEEITYAYAETKKDSVSSHVDNWQMAKELPDDIWSNSISATLAKSTGAVANSRKNPTKLAVPLFTGRPFPRPDVLCLMTPCRIDGEMFGVVGIDETGALKKI